MSTYTQILYQIVFSTKYRRPTLIKKDRPALFRFIWGLLQKKRCHLYRINGVEDHIHIILELHPSISLASLVKDIKLGSTDFIKNEDLFPAFSGWQTGYGAFTYTIESKYNLINYVKNQEEHHHGIGSKEELISLLLEHRIPFDEKYLE